MLLKDKVALITGASQGIGLATATLFAREGAQVTMAGRSMEKLCAARDALLAQVPYGQVSVILLDVSEPMSVRDAFQAIFQQAKRLDVLVSNAGVFEDSLIGMVSEEQIKRVFDTNVFGLLYCAQYASRMMARNREGSIINLASIMGIRGEVGQSVYAGSKAAVIGITKSLAKELAPQRIRVNAIAPGFIETEIALSATPEKFAQRVASISMKRAGQPHEVAQVALFLASNMSSYVTGQVIGVDGGMVV